MARQLFAVPKQGTDRDLLIHEIRINGLAKTVDGGGGGGTGDGLVHASYVTVTDQLALLDHSQQLAAGVGISLDTVGSQLVVSVTGAAAGAALNVLNVTAADSPIAVTFDTRQETYYRCDASAGPIVFNLGRAVGNGGKVGFKKLDAANAITINAFAGDQIDFLSSYTLEAADQRSVVWLADAGSGSVDVISATALS